MWVANNVFEDRETADEDQPTLFGVLYQVHDGALDITNASDFVTVLRVTLHHNLFDNVGQRAPRVRFGRVHDPDLTEDVGWTPTSSLGVEDTGRVPAAVQSEAGPFDW